MQDIPRPFDPHSAFPVPDTGRTIQEVQFRTREGLYRPTVKHPPFLRKEEVLYLPESLALSIAGFQEEQFYDKWGL